MHLTTLLREAVLLGASDLHLSSGMPPIFRIQGDLCTQPNASQLESGNLEDQLGLIRPKTGATSLEQDFSLSIPNLGRFRVNIFHQFRGTSAVFRVISEKIPSLDSLAMPPVLKHLCQLSHGLVLVTGPTGCGKSTTLASIIQHINETRSVHILTLEDPIEYIYAPEKALIQQREISLHTHSFQDALRASLREDPDVMLIGEMRDVETMRLALTAAETGHLVFATLHTNSCPETVNRIIDIFPGEDKNLVRSLLADSLQAVISQQLIKDKNGHRIAAQEIMIGTTAIKNLIRENKTSHMLSVIQTGRTYGMQTMEQSLKELKERGYLT